MNIMFYSPYKHRDFLNWLIEYSKKTFGEDFGYAYSEEREIASVANDFYTIFYGFEEEDDIWCDEVRESYKFDKINISVTLETRNSESTYYKAAEFIKYVLENTDGDVLCLVHRTLNKYHMYLSDFYSAVLSSIDVATATPQSSALQNRNHPAYIWYLFSIRCTR